jgi:1,4-alpha-glucan branching enzyme
MPLQPPDFATANPEAGRAAESADEADYSTPLPAPSGPPRAVLMLVHPRLLFLYWVVGRELEERLRRPGAAPELRLEASADGQSFREVDRQSFDVGAPGWYLSNSAVDCRVRVRLGVDDRGGFSELLTSNLLQVPREGPGGAPEIWIDRRTAGGPSPSETAPPSRPPAEQVEPRAAADRVTSPGRGPVWEQGAGARTPNLTGAPVAEGDLCLVLHSHLPFIRHPEREHFLEETWLFEAITETYLPLLDMFDHLAEDGVEARAAVSLTPTLMAMLRDPLLLSRYERHLDRTRVLAGLEVARTRRDPDFGPVAGFYRDRLERLGFLFVKKYGRDLVGRFAALESEGRIEILACAATHGFLPNLAPVPQSVRAQIALGAREHRRQIGRPPRGMWLPECAYFEGLDSVLAAEGIEYIFLDSRAIHHASSRPRLGVHAPIVSPAGVVAFGRDEESSEQVWSSKRGYPGDPTYRDFYRDIGYDLEAAYVGPFLDPSGERGFTGLKYHAITGRHDEKEPYRREQALRTLETHADDFVANRRRQAIALKSRLGRRPLMVAMYDAELFGHWWFEGPEWLETVLRRLPAAGLRAVAPGQYLADQPVQQAAEPSASSWGDGGYYQVWLAEANDWIWPPLHDASRRMADLASRVDGAGALQKRALAQLGRELLLAQASDWPFILKHQTAVGYAQRRAREHLLRFDRLAKQLEAGRVDEADLSAVEARDNLFPDLDPGIWRRS